MKLLVLNDLQSGPGSNDGDTHICEISGKNTFFSTLWHCLVTLELKPKNFGHGQMKYFSEKKLPRIFHNHADFLLKKHDYMFQISSRNCVINSAGIK